MRPNAVRTTYRIYELSISHALAAICFILGQGTVTVHDSSGSLPARTVGSEGPDPDTA
jgi:hypothetical protein